MCSGIIIAMPQNKIDELNMGWTLFVRITHWLIAALVITNFFNDTGLWHHVLGYACLGLVFFRVIYGLSVSKVSSSQLYIPSFLSIQQHLIEIFSRKIKPHAGHNPLGQCAVYLMWLLIVLLAFSGWLSRTYTFWGEAWPVDCHQLFSNLLQGLVILHLIAVVVMSILQKNNLVKRMIK